jgi:hypothetical protein
MIKAFMRYLIIFSAILFLASCKSGTMHIYLANTDSVYYCEGKQFNPANLYKGITTDTKFMNQMFSLANQNNDEIYLKAMSTFGGGGDVADSIYKFCRTIKENGLSYQMAVSDSAEKKYFNDITIIEYINPPTIK